MKITKFAKIFFIIIAVWSFVMPQSRAQENGVRSSAPGQYVLREDMSNGRVRVRICELGAFGEINVDSCSVVGNSDGYDRHAFDSHMETLARKDIEDDLFSRAIEFFNALGGDGFKTLQLRRVARDLFNQEHKVDVYFDSGVSRAFIGRRFPNLDTADRHLFYCYVLTALSGIGM
ncbi:MAG: hypothetical protein AB7G93_15345 [Bdellovibrionales bacterium]